MITAPQQPALSLESLRVQGHAWYGPREALMFDEEGCREALLMLDRPCHVVHCDGRLGLIAADHADEPGRPTAGATLMTTLAPVPPTALGSAEFRAAHGVHLAYAAGAMANGIASAELVIALGRARLLASFGAGGLPPPLVEAAIATIQQALPEGPYAFNLIHSPSEERLERGAVELYLAHGVRTVEASAYLALTPHVVRYRVAGLRQHPSGAVEATNKVIAKLSRPEVAAQFLAPPPPRILGDLLTAGLIGEEQARLAAYLPMADDITVEGDSGGHTDNRPLVCLLPTIQTLRDEAHTRHGYPRPVRVGAAGGIGTAAAALGAFMMGAEYVVTGSVNQACVEAGVSEWVRRQLAAADLADVMMAPAADMFELGVKLQVLKRGTMFAVRAQKLFELYRAYDSLEAIPPEERATLERQIFRRPLDEIWQEAVRYFTARDPEQLRRAEASPKRKMALVFRWYLGLSSRWANTGEPGRELDYQIWCGPAMGAFNGWVRGSALEEPANRRVATVATAMMTGAAYLYRVRQLQLLGVTVSPGLRGYVP